MNKNSESVRLVRGIQLCISLNIIKETPPHLTPKQFTERLQKVIRELHASRYTACSNSCATSGLITSSAAVSTTSCTTTSITRSTWCTTTNLTSDMPEIIELPLSSATLEKIKSVVHQSIEDTKINSSKNIPSIPMKSPQKMLNIPSRSDETKTLAPSSIDISKDQKKVHGERRQLLSKKNPAKTTSKKGFSRKKPIVSLFGEKRVDDKPCSVVEIIEEPLQSSNTANISTLLEEAHNKKKKVHPCPPFIHKEVQHVNNDVEHHIIPENSTSTNKNLQTSDSKIVKKCKTDNLVLQPKHIVSKEAQNKGELYNKHNLPQNPTSSRLSFNNSQNVNPRMVQRNMTENVQLQPRSSFSKEVQNHEETNKAQDFDENLTSFLEEFGYQKYFDLYGKNMTTLEYILKDFFRIVQLVLRQKRALGDRNITDVIEILRFCHEKDLNYYVPALCSQLYGNIYRAFATYHQKNVLNIDCLRHVCDVIKRLYRSSWQQLEPCGEKIIQLICNLLSMNARGQFVDDLGFNMIDLFTDIISNIREVIECEGNLSNESSANLIDIALKAISPDEVLQPSIDETSSSSSKITNFKLILCRWRWMLEDSLQMPQTHSLFLMQVDSVLQTLSCITN